jgi:hypothetical protein
MAPRKGRRRRDAISSPPPAPKMSVRSPQCEQMKPLMFSMTPRTGTRSWRNILMPRLTSAMLTSCGVVTMTAPVNGIAWARLSCASPVPGGRSTTR